ncbi:TetR/AcrR family transcriptional regulator [Allopusillimonas soli]|uniref:TetR/AcrR family transcriptional regulator n=1 Tax=Allopusillimonas soli TaxID=659016 RepID=A0A853F9J5_9BURK|nr:TetR/AcrR family transcriptional regulator [Allopusillimonas soli]NYT37354.1 TetR/AcrR family transcriptional regulator [Allopusillimonas soli]TEA74664.1 TetR/AcrR family transcriptional regulator [Allopusillimonas soli]
MSVELSPRATEIADQTKLLLASGGYNGFSYADISDRVHIGKASIHHHFPSKAELVQTVVVRHREQTQEGMAALDRQLADPLERLEAYTGYWSKCIREGTAPICICAMLAAELPMIPKEVADEVHGYFEDLAAWLARILEDGATKGQFKLRDSAVIEAQTLMSTVHGAMLTARALGKPEIFESISQAAISQLSAPG